MQIRLDTPVYINGYILVARCIKVEGMDWYRLYKIEDKVISILSQAPSEGGILQMLLNKIRGLT